MTRRIIFNVTSGGGPSTYDDAVAESLSAADAPSATITAGGGTSVSASMAEALSALDAQSCIALRAMRLASDVSNVGAWSASSGNDLYAMTNEAVRDSNTYIYSPFSPQNARYVGRFAAPTSIPTVTSDHKLEYALRGNGTGASAVVALYCGTTLVAGPWTHSNLGAEQVFAQTLTAEQAAVMSADYSDVRFDLMAY